MAFLDHLNALSRVQRTASPVERVAPLITYVYPFRLGVMASLTIPMDANGAEIRRLTAWVRTMAIDCESEAGS